MTLAIMSEKQQDLLNQLEDSRVMYEAFEEDLARRVADDKWEAKTRMRQLIREARQEGVPYRQIGFALKTSDHKTLKDLEQNRRSK